MTDVSTTLTAVKVIFRVKENDSKDCTSLHTGLYGIILPLSSLRPKVLVLLQTVNMGLFSLQSTKVSDPVRLFSLLSLGEIGRHMYVQNVVLVFVAPPTSCFQSS